MKDWWQHPIRLFCIEPSSRDLNRLDVKKMVADMNKWHANVIHFGGFYHGGQAFYQTALSPKVPNLGSRDLLKEFSEEARRRDMKLIGYVSTSWYSGDWGAKHPDWVQRDLSGRPVDLSKRYSEIGFAGDLISLCPNGPYWDHLLAIIEEIMRKYSLNGIFMDSLRFYPESCYCVYCQTKFQKELGKNLPQKLDREFAEWKIKCLNEAVSRVTKAVKNIRKDAILYTNMHHGIGVTGIHLGAPTLTDLSQYPEQYVEVQDLAGLEGFLFWGNPNNVATWHPGIQGKFGRALGKRTIVFVFTGDFPYEYGAVHPTEMKLAMAEVLANGASPGVYAEDYGYWENPHNVPPVAEMLGFLEKYSELYEDLESIANVALLVSNQQSLGLMERFDSHDIADELRGVYEVLIRSHIPFDLILDKDVKMESMANYDAVVLPNVTCLSDAQLKEIKAYVNGGGGLVATYETSLRDTHGEERGDLGLADLFKVSYLKVKLGPIKWDYMRLKKNHTITKAVASNLVPLPRSHLICKAEDASNILAYMLPLRSHTFTALADETTHPSLVVSKHGNGRVVYFPSSIGAHYWERRIPEHKDLLSNAVGWAAGGRMDVEVDTLGTVEVTAFSQKGGKRRIIHFINFTSGPQRPIEAITPIFKVKVHIRIDSGDTVQSVHLLNSGTTLQFSQVNGYGVSFELPRLEEYEVAVVETK